MVVLRQGSQAVRVVIVEPQLRWKVGKRRAWAGYWGEAYQRYGCRVVLLVVTPDPGVARRAAEPIDLDGLGSVLKPRVLGPGLLPVMLEVKEAQANPELAVVSVLAHGREASAVEQAKVALRAVLGLDDERARAYADLVFGALSKAMQLALEEWMRSETQYQSEFARKYLAQGLEKGLARGREEGREEGVSKGEARALLTFLRARGVAVDARSERRIASCTNPRQLERWVKRAATVAHVRELFAPGRRTQASKKPRAR
jgi:hypothetical protein